MAGGGRRWPEVAVELVALSLSSDESSIFSNLAQSMPHGKASTVTAVWFFESRMYLDSTETSVPSTRELAFIKWRTWERAASAVSAVVKAAAQVPVAAPLLVAVAAAAVAAAHVVVDLEAHEVGGEDAAQDLLAERQRLIDLGRREGRVQEPADLRLRMPAGRWR